MPELRFPSLFATLLLVVHSASAQDSSPTLAAAAAAATNRPAATHGGGTLFQVSTLDALLQGIYNGSFTVGQLKQQGDFGLGTYSGLDGEMIAVNGHFYQVRSNGVVSEAADDQVVPFAAVTKFKAGVQFTVRDATLPQLTALIDGVLPSKNFFYAIRIHGIFAAITTRSVPIQFLPYPPLAAVIPSQSLFNYTNVAGTAVDIYSPAFASGINQAGHHFHFVSDDLKGGGHALSFTTGPVTVEIQTLRRHSLWLPNDESFVNATLPFQ